MPLYEYVCSKCDLKFELLRSINQRDKKASCPHCHNSAERILSPFASFSKSESGVNTPIAGSSCSSCSTASCDSCNL